MWYQVTMKKTITLSLQIQADNPEQAGIVGRNIMIEEDETTFIEDTDYGPAEVYELEMENN
jgi:hypothetical protein